MQIKANSFLALIVFLCASISLYAQQKDISKLIEKPASRKNIITISKPENNYIISFKVSKEIMNYIFPKGYVAINGVSLTISDVIQSNNTFKVYLIPETLHRTNWSTKVVGDLINIEIDYQTRNTVDTITRITKEHIDA